MILIYYNIINISGISIYKFDPNARDQEGPFVFYLNVENK